MATTASLLFPADTYTAFYRAVHFVAAKKEKVLDQLNNPPAESAAAKPDGADNRTAISDITNLKKDQKPSTPRTKESEKRSDNAPAENPAVRKKIDDDDQQKAPLQRFRKRYLIVSDFTGQLWCEQQLAYNFDPPPGVVISEKPQMTKGTDLHLARELEVQDIVEVDVTSREDAFALKLLNLISCLQDFLTGECNIRREIPIFGTPFQLDLFVVGIIDEVRFNSETKKVDVVELKTRLAPRLPSRAQKKTHSLQVMLYRRMWNDLVNGQLTKEAIVRHMQLSPDTCLGEGICAQLRNLKLFEDAASVSLDSLLTRFFADITSLPAGDQLFVEYCHQETKECFAVETVAYDETWLRRRLDDSSSYWRGEREPRGVEIEEAWKCKFCDFSDVCAWRLKKQDECASKNRQNFSATAFVASHKPAK